MGSIYGCAGDLITLVSADTNLYLKVARSDRFAAIFWLPWDSPKIFDFKTSRWAVSSSPERLAETKRRVPRRAPPPRGRCGPNERRVSDRNSRRRRVSRGLDGARRLRGGLFTLCVPM